MTKKIFALMLVLLVVLTGCTDAKAGISDKNKAVITIGDKKITRGELYEKMVSSDLANTIVNGALATIAEKEVEITDDIKKSAQELYDETKDSFDSEEKFKESIEAYFGSLEAFMDKCIENVRVSALQDKYIDDNIEDMLKKDNPLKARMMYFSVSSSTTSEEVFAKAQAARDRVAAGESFETVAKDNEISEAMYSEKIYVRSDETLDYNVLTYLQKATTTGLSDVITNKNTNGYYVIQITNTNIEQIKEDYIASVKADSKFQETANAYYLKKHNFTVYDIDIYNLIKTNYPEYLVQSTGKK